MNQLLYQQYGLGATVQDLAAAIARMEGSSTPGSICGQNNNPGCLRSGPGQVGTSGGFAVFPDQATGEAALESQIDSNVSLGLNLNQFFAGQPGVYPGYAPAADNNAPLTYASNVAQWTGIDPTVPLSQIITSSDSGSASDLSLTDATDASAGLFDQLDSFSFAGMSGTIWAGVGLGLILLVLAFQRR